MSGDAYKLVMKLLIMQSSQVSAAFCLSFPNIHPEPNKFYYIYSGKFSFI